MNFVIMADFRVSLEDLLTWCRPVVGMNIPQRILFFESKEQGWIHYVPRLLTTSQHGSGRKPPSWTWHLHPRRRMPYCCQDDNPKQS